MSKKPPLPPSTPPPMLSIFNAPAAALPEPEVSIFCKNCSVGYTCTGVPELAGEDPISLARRINEIAPEHIAGLQDFLDAHTGPGHEWDLCSIEPYENYRKRS